MGDCTIRVRIDLYVRLIDTTTGRAVNELNVQFLKDGYPTKPVYKGDGNFIFINTGRENGLMHIKAYGYEEIDVPINYEELGEVSPERDVFLIPSEDTKRGESVIGISGILPSLKTIDAVNLSRSLFSFSDYNVKKNEMTVFGFVAGKTVRFDDVYYGMTAPDEKSFDSFTVANQSGDNKAVLKEPLVGEAKPNRKIYRLLFGDVKKDGSFVFRVRDDAAVLNYLIRFTVGDDTYFRIIDFRQTYGTVDLMEDAVKLEAEAKEEEAPDDAEVKDMEVKA